MLWFAIWAVLVLAAVALFAALGRSLWRKGTALVRELGEAAEVLARAQAQVERLQRPDTDPTPAIFSDPQALRAERERRLRARSPRRRMTTSRAGG